MRSSSIKCITLANVDVILKVGKANCGQVRSFECHTKNCFSGQLGASMGLLQEAGR